MSDTVNPEEVPTFHKLSLEPAVDEKASANSTRTPSFHSIPASDTRSQRKFEDYSGTLKTSDTDYEQPTGPIRTPFAHPVSSCKPLPRAALTAEQARKYDSLLATVLAWTHIPTTSTKNSPATPIEDDERMWLTRECLLRYLRATSWNTAEASKRLLNTITWRREYEVASITGDMVSVENETGKQRILGYDINARPCLHMSPGKQNTKKSEMQIKHLVFMLERAVDLMPPGQETTALLIDFKNSTSGGSPSVGQGKQTLTILQGHYPERLGKALISDLPWYIATFFKLISPFIDPVTKEKMVFNQDLRRYVPPSQLDKAYNGDADFEYDHSQYWPALNRLCQERRAAYRERWVQAGSKIGEYEMYLRGGNQKSLVALSEDGEAAPTGSRT